MSSAGSTFPAMTGMELTYAYRMASAVRRDGGGSEVLLGTPAGRTLTLATAPRPGAACLAGSHRLTELGPLLRFARALRVYAPEADTRSLPMPSAWELDLNTARFTLTL